MPPGMVYGIDGPEMVAKALACAEGSRRAESPGRASLSVKPNAHAVSGVRVHQNEGATYFIKVPSSSLRWSPTVVVTPT